MSGLATEALTPDQRLILGCLATTNPRGLPLTPAEFHPSDVELLQERRLIRFDGSPGVRLWFITPAGLDVQRTIQASSEGQKRAPAQS